MSIPIRVTVNGAPHEHEVEPRLLLVHYLATDGELHPIQAGFKEMHGLQCGFCTPGMIMTAWQLLERNPDPTDDEIRHGLEGNYCRCTGYDKIVRAGLDAAQKMK